MPLACKTRFIRGNMEISQYLPVLHELYTPVLDGFYFLVLKILLIVSGIELNPGPKNGLNQNISTSKNTPSTGSVEHSEIFKNVLLLEESNMELLDRNDLIKNLIEEVKDLKIKLNKQESEMQSLNSHAILREQISHACLTGKWDEVKKILERFFTTDSVEYKQIVKINNVNYLPTEAVQNGYMMLIQILLIHGLPVNRKYGGNSLLHVASGNGQADLAKLLVTHGADVNMKNNDNNTPLHCAACNGYVNTVKVLLEHGAYINAKNSQGNTALHLAAYFNKVSVVKCLFNNDCNTLVTNNDDDTALEMALEKKNNQIVRLLSSK